MVVSDTVRLRRARTPSNGNGGAGSANGTVPLNLPDLLPNTFRLAEQSALFSHFNNSPATEDKPLAVSTSHVSHITLEKVQYFEPEHAETVNIVDLSEDNASDSSEPSTRKSSSSNEKSQMARDEFKKLVTERINSFYESDKEGHEEPLVFSEDEDTELIGANMVQ